MPVESRAKWSKLKVGILAIVAMVILAIIIFLITGTSNPFQSKTEIFTYLDDAAALQAGAPVNLNGIPVGTVKSITLTGSKQPGRIVRVAMQLNADMLSQIPIDSLASISAANVLGTKFINIKKGKSETTVRPGQEIPALNTADFDTLIQQGNTMLASLQSIIQRVDRIVGLIENGQGSIGKLLVDETLYNHLLAIVSSAERLTTALNSDKGTIGKLIYSPELYQQVQASLGRVDTLLDDLQAGKGTAGKLLKDPALYNQTQQTVTDIDKLVADLNAGKGTAGKLLKSTELHDQLKATIAKLDITIDKINSGQGTIGQLMVNSQLYDNMNGATRELHELLKDFRANPKKFLRIKLSIF